MKQATPALHKQTLHTLLLACLVVFLLPSFPCAAQTLSPQVVPTTGGVMNGSGTTLSYTIGEPATATLQNGTVVLTQGEQQPYITLRLLNLRAYIQGFYLGGGQMQAVLYNDFPSDFSPTDCDSILVELHDALSPDDIAASSVAILQTDGSATLKFPASVNNSSYYIVLHHRNSIETWSKDPVTFGAVTFFDFTGQ